MVLRMRLLIVLLVLLAASQLHAQSAKDAVLLAAVAVLLAAVAMLLPRSPYGCRRYPPPLLAPAKGRLVCDGL